MARPLTSQTFEPSFRGGSGKPLVLLHGGTGTWHAWSALLPDLTNDHDVVAPTLPGHHGGPPLEAPVDIGTFADGVERVMDEAGFDHAHVAGYSLGGWTALELARRGRALSVVALSPAGGWAEGDRRVRRIFLGTDRLLRVSRPLLPLTMRSKIIRRLGFRYVAARGDRLTKEAALIAIEGALHADLLGPGQAIFDQVCDEVAGTGVPILVAWGDKDRLLLPRHYAEGWRRAIQAAEWRVLPGVGHIPVFDDPDLVATTIRAWVAEAEDEPA